MVIISQNTFLIWGILFFCFFRVAIKIKGIIKKEHIYKSIYSSEEFMFDLFCIYIIGVISRVYFPLTIAWGNHIVYSPPEIWLRPIWSIKQIYLDVGLSGVIYQLTGNLIVLSPMAFFICYFYSIDEEKLTLGKRIIKRINKLLESFERRNKEGIRENSYIPSIKTILKVCFLIALFIESSQVVLSLVFPNTKRFFEINDLICNTLSGIWGYYIYNLFINITVKSRNICKF
ncbi:VanZ family protein [Clostridium sp. LIBA-8841]|uniref:VanZ family protein n=1 Tax=Clostridium sp. LIBA-8841 TaxID=2987530 RepID=UPI002AC65119|nr:VanZ family protein [Clostridium sp. LIBA-8841]MDZ5254352.1 VanZ family protein [Clostridium sp. LIBA-8841]